MTAWICSSRQGLRLNSRFFMLKRKQLLSRLKSETPRQFCENHLFADDAFLFSDTKTGVTGNYDDFRTYIAKQFDVNAKAIAVVGSAKLGYSLRV